MTAFEHNSLAHAVLGAGRRLFALVADIASKDNVENQIDVACTRAMKGGWFAEHGEAEDMIVESVLPSTVPPNNVSQAVHDNMADSLCTFEDDSDTSKAEWAFEVAKEIAEDYGIEVRVGARRHTGFLFRFAMDVFASTLLLVLSPSVF